MFKIGALFLQNYIQPFFLKYGLVVLILKAVTGGGGKECYFYFLNLLSVTTILIIRQQNPCRCFSCIQIGRVPTQTSQLRTLEAQLDWHISIWIASSGLYVASLWQTWESMKQSGHGFWPAGHLFPHPLR